MLTTIWYMLCTRCSGPCSSIPRHYEPVKWCSETNRVIVLDSRQAYGLVSGLLTCVGVYCMSSSELTRTRLFLGDPSPLSPSPYASNALHGIAIVIHIIPTFALRVCVVSCVCMCVCVCVSFIHSFCKLVLCGIDEKRESL